MLSYNILVYYKTTCTIITTMTDLRYDIRYERPTARQVGRASSRAWNDAFHHLFV